MNTKFNTSVNKNELQDFFSEDVTLKRLLQVEKQVLEFWESMDLEKKVLEKNRGNTPFSFFDGPVTANNPMGVHHAWGRTYKDVVQRFRSMLGYDLRYQNGFDTQGLWVEVEVEKALDLRNKKDLESFGLRNFVQACKNRVAKYSLLQTEQSKRLGQLMDWDNSYYTHTDQNVEAIWHFLKLCHQKGWLYKKGMPMPWCYRCGTSLSAHEQADSHKMVQHPSLYLKLPFGKNTYLLVWTTTPWTLSANMAVAFNPDLEYGLFELDGEQLLAGLWLEDNLLSGATLLRKYSNEELQQLQYALPFSEFEQVHDNPRGVYPWKEVTMEEGTGLVHVAPGCGPQDYQLGQELGLPELSPLDANGQYLDGFGPFSGMMYHEVNQHVVEYLETRNLVFSTSSLNHRYPHCWRCGTELVYRLVEEWFLSSDEVRPLMQQAAQTVTWKPAYVGKLFQDWLRNMGDWCISRKRYWGLPLPFYPCECGHLNVLGSRKEFDKRAVGDLSKVTELHLPWVDEVMMRCEVCDNAVSRVPEVGDCWLDAGVMPFSTVSYFEDQEYWQKWFPAEYVVEMREQVRLWFYATMFMSVTLTGKAPYKNVGSYEKVHDKHGNPMHKSKGNAVWLDDALELAGADSLRLMYLMSNRSQFLKFDLDVANDLGRKVLLKFANVVKFFVQLSSLDNYQPKGQMSNHLMDRWLLSRLAGFSAVAQDSLKSYTFVSYANALEDFVNDLSTWYLRRSRRRFWKSRWTRNKQSAFDTLFFVLKEFSKLMAPAMPFLAELAYQSLVSFEEGESVHLEYWDDLQEYRDVDLEQDMELCRNLVSDVLQLRHQHSMRVRQPLKQLYVLADPDTQSSLERLSKELLDEVNVKKMYFVDTLDFALEHSWSLNLPFAGKHFKKKMAEVRTLLEQTPDKSVLDFLLGKDAELDLGEFTVPRDAFHLKQVVSTRYAQHKKTTYSLLLDLKLSKSLKEQGFLREFVRSVQMARKNAGLNMDEFVTLDLVVSESLEPLFLKYEKTLCQEVQCSSLNLTDSLGEEGTMLTFDNSRFLRFKLQVPENN